MTRTAWLAAALPTVSLLALAFPLALLLPDGAQAWAEYDRAALIRGEWWRLWTGHLVHADISHALSAACAWAGLACLSRTPHRLAAALLLVIAPLLSAALLALPLLFPLPGPVLDHYRGASGLLFVWLAYLLCHPAAAALKVTSGWRHAVALVVTLKLAWDLHVWLNIAPSHTVQVAGEVHVIGALFGVVFAFCVTFTAVPHASTRGPGSSDAPT